MRKAFFALIVIQIASTANAYRLYNTPNGSLVRWNLEEVELVLDPSLDALGPRHQVEADIRGAVALWEREGDLPVHFTLVDGDCNSLENDGNNCIFACTSSDECPSDKHDKGAGTFLSVAADTGVIKVVDIIFYASDWEWKKDHHSSHSLNLRTVAIHELGHALGIDHSEEEEAAMYPSICPGSAERTDLHSDDINAAETLYDGFTPSAQTTYGCSIDGVGKSSENTCLILITLLSAGLLIRRGRKETY